MELAEFIVKACKNTYASGKESQKLDDGSDMFVYEEDGFKFIDKYYGGEKFIGETIIFKDNKPIWGMNYSGVEMPNKELTIKQIISFLKDCLMQTSEQHPLRGPPSIKQGHFYYLNKVVGNLKEFIGKESILYKGQEVFRCQYHGGFIK